MGRKRKKIFLENKNRELADIVIKKLTPIGYVKDDKRPNVWKKDIPNSHFYILFHKKWLTFALCLKDIKYECEARKILSCKMFDRYNLTPLREGLHYDEWVYRNFYYPNARAYEEDIINTAVNAFKQLECCVQNCTKCMIN